MPIKEAGMFQQQVSITSSTAAADRTIKLTPRKGLTATLELTSGSPTTGARLQITQSTEAEIEAGTAVWTNSQSGYTTVNRAEANPGEACNMTAVRADVSDGTWSLKVRQS